MFIFLSLFSIWAKPSLEVFRDSQGIPSDTHTPGQIQYLNLKMWSFLGQESLESTDIA